MQLCGPADTSYSDDVPVGGNLSLGFIDQSQYTGSLYKAKIVKEDYYRILITDMKVKITDFIYLQNKSIVKVHKFINPYCCV